MAVAHGIKTLGVLGSGGHCLCFFQNILIVCCIGQMGLGIAYVSALRAKVPVLLADKSPTQIKSGLALFEKLLARDMDKGKISSEDAKQTRDRLRVVDDVKSLRDVDMVIEVGNV
jgi:3-hydroxybutyryl-CoA dehydrogenase